MVASIFFSNFSNKKLGAIVVMILASSHIFGDFVQAHAGPSGRGLGTTLLPRTPSRVFARQIDCVNALYISVQCTLQCW